MENKKSVYLPAFAGRQVCLLSPTPKRRKGNLSNAALPEFK